MSSDSQHVQLLNLAPVFWDSLSEDGHKMYMAHKDMIYFVNGNWVYTRWQQYSTHLHTNSTRNNRMKTNTQNGTYITIIQGVDKSLARPGRKQSTETEDFEFHISYL